MDKERLQSSPSEGPPHFLLGETDGKSRRTDENELWRKFSEAKTPEIYYQAWLALQCSLIQNVSDAVVLLGKPDEGPFKPAAFWPDVPRKEHPLSGIAEKALRERKGLILKCEAPGSTKPALKPGYHVAYPLLVAGRLHGVVALSILSRSEQHLRSVIRQLQWGSGWLKSHFDEKGSGQSGPRLVLELVATIVEQDRFQAAATAFVTDLATRLECERVSLGFVRKGQIHVKALSHSAQLEKKTNLIRSIETAMEEALDQEEVITLPPMSGTSFQITREHESLSRENGESILCSVPLSQGGNVIGVLTLERSKGKPFDFETIQVCEAVGAMAGPMLDVHRREDRLLLTKIMEAFLQQLKRLFGPRYIVRKLVTVCLLALVIFFANTKGDYYLKATTVIEPAIRRVAVAPFDGYIEKANVRAGDLVKSGQVLVRLDDHDLQLERNKWRSQREKYVKEHQLAIAKRDAAQVEIVSSQIDQAEAELALVEDHLSRTEILAQFDGFVVTGDLSQSIGAPVERGQVLFEVAPLDVYRIILQLDERDMANISVGQAGHIALSAFPSEPMPFTINKITPVSIAKEGRNYFRVEAALEREAANLRPGMEGISKVKVDRRLLLWIWTHEALDWARLLLWSWWP